MNFKKIGLGLVLFGLVLGVGVGIDTNIKAEGAYFPTIERASVSSEEVEGNIYSHNSSISADGRYIAFDSFASNLVPNDTKNRWDIFVRDRIEGTTTRVSVSSEGAESNGASRCPSISADGRFIAFSSESSNLVPNDNNGNVTEYDPAPPNDIFVHDRIEGTTTRVSISSNGEEGNGSSEYFPSISADSRYITFSSKASNLVPNDDNNVNDIFVHDRIEGTTTRVSVSSEGTESDSSSYHPTISADGRYVAFESFASNLVPNDDNNVSDIFVHDRVEGTTTRVSVSSEGTEGNYYSYHEPLTISADGRFIAFSSEASNLVPNDTNAMMDVFVHDRVEGTTTRANVSSYGVVSDMYSSSPSISADGRFVTFFSQASNLVPNDTNGTFDLFVHDNIEGTTARISVSSEGVESNDTSLYISSISADGHYISFRSEASNLVPNDNNVETDIFVATNPLFDDDDPISSFFQCSDGLDNDADGFIDASDPGCHADHDANNPDSYDPNYDKEGDIEEIGLLSIRDDETGGDCLKIGTWNSDNKTCTFTKDLFGQIQIVDDYITIDGGTHKIVNDFCNKLPAAAIHVSKVNGITIRNLTIDQSCYYGIESELVNNLLVEGNTFRVSNPEGFFHLIGIYAHGQDTEWKNEGIIIRSNTFNGSGVGWGTASVSVQSAENIFIGNNSIGEYGALVAKDLSGSYNILYNTLLKVGIAFSGTDSNNRGLVRGNNLIGGGISGDKVYKSEITANILSGDGSIRLTNISDSVVAVNKVMHNGNSGITLINADRNQVIENTISNFNDYSGGLIIAGSADSVERNIISGARNGIDLNGGNHYLADNTITHSTVGIHIQTEGNFPSFIKRNKISNIGDGIQVNSQFNNFENNIISDCYNRGVLLADNFNFFKGDRISNCSRGVEFNEANHNQLEKLTLEGNNQGIAFLGGAYNEVFDSYIINSNINGLVVPANNYFPVNGNKVYHNNFINNGAKPYYFYAGGIEQQDWGTANGGNYWSEFDTPAEGCSDGNFDGFCDAKYLFGANPLYVYESGDYKPYKRENGWLEALNHPPVITVSPATVHIGVGGSYSNTEAMNGVSVSNSDGPAILPSAVTIFNNVNVNVPGTYVIRYSVQDDKGAVGTAERTVIVEALSGGLSAPIGFNSIFDVVTQDVYLTWNWTGDLNKINGFKVYRKETGGEAKLIGTSNTYFYIDHNVPIGTTFDYWVTSYITGNESVPTVVKTVSTGKQPGKFELSAVASCDTQEPVGPAVKLEWDPSAGATSYQIYRNEVLYPVDSGMGMKFTNNTNLTVGETYKYKIRAINASGFTDSNEMSVEIKEGVCGNTASLKLLGDETMVLNYGAAFNDPGATAFDNNGTSVPVKITGADLVDTKEPTTYIITYSANINNKTIVKERLVVVKNRIDETYPFIRYRGEKTTYLKAGSVFNIMEGVEFLTAFGEPYVATDLYYTTVESHSLDIYGLDSVVIDNPGTYRFKYYIWSSNHAAVAALERIAVVSGSGTNNDPKLSVSTYPNEEGLYRDGIKFTIYYTDADNNPPEYLLLNINGSEYTPTLVEGNANNSDDNYVNSEEYEYFLQAPGARNYAYFVKTSDGVSSVQTETKNVVLKDFVAGDFAKIKNDICRGDCELRGSPSVNSNVIDSLSNIFKTTFSGGKVLEHSVVNERHWLRVEFVGKNGGWSITGWVLEDAFNKNDPPTASISFSSNLVRPGESATINASGSYDFNYDGKLLYGWDLDGDGAYEGVTSNSEVMYRWLERGSYMVTVRVWDLYGAYDDTKELMEVSGKRFEYFSGLTKITDKEFDVIKNTLLGDCSCISSSSIDNPLCSDYCALIDDKKDPDDYLRYILNTTDVSTKEAPGRTFGTTISAFLFDKEYIESVLSQRYKLEYMQQWQDSFPSYTEIFKDLSCLVLESPLCVADEILGYADAFASLGILNRELFLNGLHDYLTESDENIALSQACDANGAFCPSAYNRTEQEQEQYRNDLKKMHERVWSCGGPDKFGACVVEKTKLILSDAIEMNSLIIDNYLIEDIDSPGELRMYDKNERVTGIVNGEIKEEIPNSFYDEEDHAVIIINPADISLYHYVVFGIEKPDERTYGLTITSMENGKETAFKAIDVPTTQGEVHQYFVDWQTLAQGGHGVTMKIDKEGDGVFENTVVSDATMELPVAVAGGPYAGTEGTLMTFDASLSKDADGSIKLYEWDFDEDGDYEKNSTSPIITNIYENDYNGTVGLRVTDDEGLTATDTAEVIVSNVAPVVEAGADITAQYSNLVQFGGNFTDPGSQDTHTIKWDFGDGGTAIENLAPTHSYAKPGEYNVVLTVTDDDGGIGQDNLRVNVTKEVVIITVENQEGSFGDAAILKATVLDDDGQVLSHGPYKANFMVGDKQIGEADIDENGKAEISWVVDYIPTDLSEVKMIAVGFGENEYYLAGEGQGNLTVKSAKQLKQDSLDKLKGIKNDDKQVQKEIDKAIGGIESSLGAGLWADASHLDQKQGHKVFDSDKQAIKSLLKIIEEKGNHENPEIAAGLQAVIDGLVKADVLIAKVAISDAENVKSDKPKTQEKIDSEIIKAKADLEKALQELAGGDLDKAIDDLKKSWNSAQSAMSFL